MNMPTDNLPDVNQFAAAATQPAGGGDGPDAIKLTEPGEFLYGVVTATKYGLTTQYGDADLIEMADQQRGPVAFWCTNAQTRNGIVNGQNQAGRPVQTGDLLYVRFDGKQALDGGKTLSLYSINVQAPGGATTTPAAAVPASTNAWGAAPAGSQQPGQAPF